MKAGNSPFQVHRTADTEPARLTLLYFDYARIFRMRALAQGPNVFFTDNENVQRSAIVFIHGFPLNHTMWQEQAALVQSSFRVITYDQRGHGQSAAGDGQFMLESFVDDLLGLLDALRIQKAILCGLSMGGYVALRTYERQPGKVLGLILCDTRSQADTNEAKLKRAASIRALREQGISAFAEGFLKNLFTPSSFLRSPEAVEAVRKMILACTLQGLIGTQIALATRTDTTASLARIRVPTLILVGAHDVITPPAAAAEMHERIAGSKMSIIPDAGHISNLENPDFFNHEMMAFLTKAV